MSTYRIVSRVGKHHDIWKLIIFAGLVTVTSSVQESGDNSGVSGTVRTVRLSLLWLFGATLTISTVQHRELGLELRIGPIGVYLSLEDYPGWMVR